MLIVDAQVHVWERGQATGHHRKSPITMEVLSDEMSTAGVDRALLVPPLWDPTGNSYALRLAQEHPDIFAVMGVLQFDDGVTAGAPDPLAEWSRIPAVRGVRLLLNSPERLKHYHEGCFDNVWPSAEKHGITLALLVPNSLYIASDIARMHPDLKIIVDHLGVPRGAKGPSAFAHLPDLLKLAKFPNISIKAAGVGDYALDDYPFKSLDEPLRRIFDTFGPDRIVWASDLSRLHHPYRQCTTHFAEELSWLSDEDRSQIMGRNLCRIIGWGVERAAV